MQQPWSGATASPIWPPSTRVAGADRRPRSIVLPEMFTTGFAMDAGEKAPPEQQVIDWLHGWAVKATR
ncbi:hypothetical protein M8494_22295 [Serratia ureilytica]